MIVIREVKEFAHAAHDSIEQKRKYSGDPYWVHTDAVEALYATYFPADMVGRAVCHLHDVLEDVFPVNPKYGPFAIEEAFGTDVLQGVVDLTDQYIKENYPDWNRALRKRKERERLGLIPVRSMNAKLCDLCCNTIDIVKQDPNFAKVYIKEKLALLPYLQYGHPHLLAYATELATKGARELGLY